VTFERPASLYRSHVGASLLAPAFTHCQVPIVAGSLLAVLVALVLFIFYTFCTFLGDVGVRSISQVSLDLATLCCRNCAYLTAQWNGMQKELQRHSPFSSYIYVVLQLIFHIGCETIVNCPYSPFILLHHYIPTPVLLSMMNRAFQAPRGARLRLPVTSLSARPRTKLIANTSRPTTATRSVVNPCRASRHFYSTDGTRPQYVNNGWAIGIGKTS
jgi:hypothetical protein